MSGSLTLRAATNPVQEKPGGEGWLLRAEQHLLHQFKSDFINDDCYPLMLAKRTRGGSMSLALAFQSVPARESVPLMSTEVYAVPGKT